MASGPRRGDALAAIISQAIAAGASLVLQVLAWFELGKAALGTFAILSAGIIVTINALHTGWIGDALAVFDRHEPGIRGALIRSSQVSAVLTVFVSFASAIIFAGQSIPAAALFSAATLVWTLEETGRRIFMARLEFWKLVVNDSIYAVVALGVAGFATAFERLTITWLVFAILAGATASWLASMVQLPRSEWSTRITAKPRMRELTDFSLWRAGQIGVRPLSMLLSRVVIASVTSTAQLGFLESGRLLLAPVFTAANGLGAFLLPHFAKQSREGDDNLSSMWKLAGMSGLVAAVFGAVAVALSPLLGKYSPGHAVPITLVLSWAVYAIAYCANIPVVNALVAQRNSKILFRGRLIDGAIGVALSYVFAVTIGVVGVPIGLALGVVVGTIVPVLYLHRNGKAKLPRWLEVAIHGETPKAGRLVSLRPVLFPYAWVTILPLMLIIGTEYKTRIRKLASSLDGSIDAAVMIEIGIYGLVAVYLVAFATTAPRLRRPTAIQFMMRAYAALLTASALFSVYPKLGAVRGIQLIIMVSLAGAIANRASRDQMYRLANGYIALVTGSVFVGLVWRVPFSVLQADRFNWMYVHSVIAAAMLGISVTLAYAFLLRLPKNAPALWPRWVYGFCFAVGTGALIATKTRGSLAGALIGVAVISVLRIPRRERLPVAVVGLLGLGVTLMLAINPLIEYVTRGESVESLETLSNRTTLWTIAFDFFGQKPVFGWGITASRGLFFEQVNLGGAHNALVNVLVDGGLVGTGLWVGLIVAILAGIHRLGPQEPDSKLLYGLVATMLVNSMTTEGLGSGSGVSAMWLFLVGAWVGVLQREHAEARRLAQLRASRMSQSTEIELVPIPTRRPTLV